MKNQSDSLLNTLGKLIKSFYSGKKKETTNYRLWAMQNSLQGQKYLNIFDEADRLEKTSTETIIQPGILGMPLHDIRRKYGRCKLKVKSQDLSIRRYQIPMNGMYSTCWIHFYKNKSFLIELVFKEITDNKIFELLVLASSKYNCAIKLNETAICDEKGNLMVFTKNLFSLKVSYMVNFKTNGLYNRLENDYDFMRKQKEIEINNKQLKLTNML